MSVLFPDLNLTNFPESVDQFLTFLNITATDGPLIAQYQTALQSGNTTLANQILAQIPSGTQKIIKATDLNKLTQAMLALERFFSTDILPYIQNQQAEWLSVINQFSYKGVWSIGISYQVNNLVTYTTSGLTLVYLATSTPPVGTVPTNTQYWRLLTIQGQPGPSGAGLSYRQEWSVSTQYQTNDAVTYDGTIWMSLQANTGVQPGTNNTVWKQIISLETAAYPIQSTEPQGLMQGDLWFNTQGNPTQYYYLAALDNPATAAQIVYGQEAYDDQGNLITGTLPVPASLAVTTNPDKMDYIVGESFDPTGMVVKVTYTSGAQKIVTGYSYSPTGPLSSGDDTITIQYNEAGTTVQTTLSINIITVDPVLNNNSWATIRAVADAGNGDNYWSVGDAKQIAINGTIGTVQYDNYQTWVYILGFNHNASLEGDNLIHFGCFRNTQNYTTTNGIALDSNQYGYGTSTINYNMNPTETNAGGWESSKMRTIVIDADAISPVSASDNSFLSALPNDLKIVLKRCTKYTDNVANNTGNILSNITATQDWAWLLSEYEIFGIITYSNNYESNYQRQYQYYIDGNSKAKYRQTSMGDTAYWWERSPHRSIRTNFNCVMLSGSSFNADATISYGFAPGFCI